MGEAPSGEGKVAGGLAEVQPPRRGKRAYCWTGRILTLQASWLRPV